jgi:hypothetical protein
VRLLGVGIAGLVRTTGAEPSSAQGALAIEA